MTKQAGAIIALICKMAPMTVPLWSLGPCWGKDGGVVAANCVGLLIFN